MKKRCSLLPWLCAAQSLAGVGCMSALAQTGHSALWALLLVLIWTGTLRFWREDDRRAKLGFGLLGAAFALCCALGVRLDAAGETGFAALGACVLAAVCLAPAAGEGFLWIVRGLGRLRTPLRLKGKTAFCLAFAVLILCWTPVLIAFFPGIDGYDIDGQHYQILSGNYSTHHPLLHTLYLQMFFRLGEWLFGSVSMGFGLSTIAQALLLAAAIAYAMWYLRHCPRGLWIGLLGFFALSPQHAVMAASAIKDIPFAAVMVVLTVEMLRFLTEPEREKKPLVWICDAALVCLACLLRNNAVYALALVVLLGAVIWRRKLGLRVLAVLAAGVIAGLGCAAGLKAATGAADGSIREMLCVPCQQLARVYDLYGLERPVGYEVLEVLPYADDYTPERADAVKRQAKVVGEGRLTRFAKLWARELLHYPAEYIDAFLLLTKGYWWVDDLSYTTTYNSPGADRGCMILWHNEATQLTMENLWPGVKALCERLFAQNEYQRFPVLWQLMQPAVYSWLLALALVWAWWTKIREVLLAGGACLCYLLTLLLGPCVLIRYQYMLMLCAPVLLGYLCADGKEDKR